MPVWNFNGLQLTLLQMVNERRKAAEDLKLLATLAAQAGSHQQAMDCYLKMLELKNPSKEQERIKFANDSQDKFQRLLKNFNKNKKKR